MKSYIRAHIALDTQPVILDFLRMMVGDSDNYVVESQDGSHCVNARSMLGLLYMATEHPKELFIRNLTHDGEFPPALDNFRLYGTPSTEKMTF